jgi:uncharacterized protein (DUF983 family)
VDFPLHLRVLVGRQLAAGFQPSDEKLKANSWKLKAKAYMSLLSATLHLRCPKCGEGRLFAGVLRLHEHCPECGFDLRGEDSGDGPVFFALVIVGFLDAALLAFLEINFALPLWGEMLMISLVTLAATLYVLRVSRAALIALQFKHRIRGFEDHHD